MSIFKERLVKCGSKNKHPQQHILNVNWTTCMFRVHCSYHAQWDYIMIKRLFTLMTYKVLVRAPNIIRDLDKCTTWVCCVFVFYEKDCIDYKIKINK